MKPLERKQTIEKILGKPYFEWETIDGKDCTCGLKEGTLETAGWGDLGACCRLWIHEDGVCIRHALDIPEDRQIAKDTYEKLISV